ncbi:DNA polymerase II [Pseudomaricurvus alkylphenolicus]|uniref:DNA polymerase II n=1 Tax=Pseudomaricurvus alkylphenolicus TaxID=1306991 RepID=UPI00142374F3|nr:DNA polymerase II [Pseudomaricurvus alkylphenolicus]NIB43970.1 DNA polymerase II [Pseudomaricurvus alkylphenolicus]
MSETGVLINPDSLQGFILTRQWEDVAFKTPFGRLRQLQMTLWLISDRGPVKVVVEGQTAVFFLPAEDLSSASAVLDRSLGKSAAHPSVTPVWEARALDLKDFRHRPVVGLYFREQRTLYKARDALKRQGFEPLEADIHPTDRYLMERFVTGAIQLQGNLENKDSYLQANNPRLAPAEFQPYYRVLSLDIETDMRAEQLYSIGAVVTETKTPAAEPQRRVFMVGEGEPPASHPYLHYVDDERQLLNQFLSWFQQMDPDVIIGWNVINFDLRALQRKADELRVPFVFGRDGQRIDWRQSRGDDDHYTLLVPGRLVMDGIDTLRSATYNFESFSLESVARELLQRGKLSEDVDHRGEAITEQFLHDKPALAAYNLEDCQLVWDIFVKARLIDFGVERARLTGLAMDRFGGSVASFDNRYLPRLHRQGFVAPALPENPVGVGSPGGYVMDSLPGFYNHVLVLDFKSLYPSIIRTFQIDPLARVCGWEHERLKGLEREPHWDRHETAEVDRELLAPGFNGAVFLKERALLPNIIGELWAARDQAKRLGNGAMSQAIKIIMNSFYGVLGTPGCRFFDYRLPSSITLRGHQILTRSRELIEEQGHRVIYGDTDSVFVCLAGVDQLSPPEIDQVGQQLAENLNRWWRDFLLAEYQLESFLEIEFETHYSRFVMPTIRGADTGSKKRYSGLVEKAGVEPELVFKGLEAVRTDWTPLAREFQRELYRRVFFDEPYREYLLGLLQEIRDGEHDGELFYRKRLRRHLEDYVRNVPPHVQAARKADEWLEREGLPQRYKRGSWVQYALTVNGPEPLEHLQSPLDYELLIERQIVPIADGILQFLGTSFEEIADQQLGLF